MPKNSNDSLILKEKDDFLSQIREQFKKNISSIEILYLIGKIRFGNLLISLNNVIFMCEIVGCKKIFLEGDEFLIKNKIFHPKYNMSIEPIYSRENLPNNTLIMDAAYFYYYRKHLKPENDFYVFKAEILNNLPKIETNSNDLYIHIRSGDVFENPPKIGYSQPPLCFYQKILREFKFRKIYIISEDKKNPIINFLLREFDNIIYNKNNLYLDISYLANAYNIVSSKSSFIITLIKINDKLRFLWEFDLYRLSERFLHLIFVDDSSKDNSRKIIEDCQKDDERILLIKNKKNRGTFISRNIGVLFIKFFIISTEYKAVKIKRRIYNASRSR